MSAHRLDSIGAYRRFGFRLHLICAVADCRHFGIAEAGDCWQWFLLHRWPDHFEAGALRRFRCTVCGGRAGQVRPTHATATVVNFFPPRRGHGVR